MMMRKFIAATSREAMQKMKAALGPDAYVISNRKIAQGIDFAAHPCLRVAARRSTNLHSKASAAVAPARPGF